VAALIPRPCGRRGASGGTGSVLLTRPTQGGPQPQAALLRASHPHATAGTARRFSLMTKDHRDAHGLLAGCLDRRGTLAPEQRKPPRTRLATSARGAGNLGCFCCSFARASLRSTFRSVKTATARAPQKEPGRHSHAAPRLSISKSAGAQAGRPRRKTAPIRTCVVTVGGASCTPHTARRRHAPGDRGAQASLVHKPAAAPLFSDHDARLAPMSKAFITQAGGHNRFKRRPLDR
jgi:hypothetical protein